MKVIQGAAALRQPAPGARLGSAVSTSRGKADTPADTRLARCLPPRSDSVHLLNLFLMEGSCNLLPLKAWLCQVFWASGGRQSPTHTEARCPF